MAALQHRKGLTRLGEAGQQSSRHPRPPAGASLAGSPVHIAWLAAHIAWQCCQPATDSTAPGGILGNNPQNGNGDSAYQDEHTRQEPPAYISLAERVRMPWTSAHFCLAASREGGPNFFTAP